MPARSDLDPLKVPQLLPYLGLIDVRNGLDQASFRLAGTRLWDVYGQEITGKRVDDVFSGERADYWRRIHERIMSLGEPLHGVVRGPAQGRDHIVLFWLRLPLSEDGGRVDRSCAMTWPRPPRASGARSNGPSCIIPVTLRTSGLELRRAQLG